MNCSKLADTDRLKGITSQSKKGCYHSDSPIKYLHLQKRIIHEAIHIPCYCNLLCFNYDWM